MIPQTMNALARVVGMFGGMLHGDDARGVVDVQFDDIATAASFAQTWRDGTGVLATLRDPVLSFDQPVVVQVSLGLDVEPSG